MKKFIETLKRLIIEYKYFILSLILIPFILAIKIPYFIYAPGGIEPIRNRYSVENEYKSSGSFNMVYVNLYEANIGLYLVSLINHDFELIPFSESLYENETPEDEDIRDHIYLDESIQYAVINAYKLSNNKYEIVDEKYKIIYVLDTVIGYIKIGDEIIKIDNKLVSSYDSVVDYIGTKKLGDEITLEVIRNKKIVAVKLPVIIYEGKNILGIVISNIYKINTTPKIKFEFNKDESGPSAGFLLSLSIYDSITKFDLTRGLKIAGSGTIDIDGNVGEIGEVEKKVASANKAKADIFFAASGDNYRDAKKLVEDKNYKIKVVEVKTINDAIDYLKKYKVK